MALTGLEILIIAIVIVAVIIIFITRFTGRSDTMPSEESLTKKEPQYVGNSNSKEIHDLSKTTNACRIDKMKDKNKVFFETLEDVERAISDEGYNGCKWCLPEYDTG